MKTDDLETLWQSPLNQPSAAQQHTQNMKFLSDLKRRRRGAVFFMGWILLVLSGLTGFVLFQFFGRGFGGGGTPFAREWAVLLLLALPWAGLVVFFRKYRRHRQAHPGYDLSIADSLRALLDENRMARSRQKWVALLWILMLLIMPLMVHQLRVVGKAGDEILVPAFVLLPMLMLAVFGWMMWHDRQVMLPRKRQLEELLAGYDGEGSLGV